MKQSIGRLLGARLLSRQAALGIGMAAAAVAGISACGGNNNNVCPNLPIADGLIGQLSFSVTPSGAIDANTLSGPIGSVGVNTAYSTYMYVADPGHNRVLAYTPVPSDTVGPAATFAIGQADLQTATIPAQGPAGDPTKNLPIGLSTPSRASVGTGGQLVIADTGNNRVLIWNNAPTNFQVPPDVVLGQPGLTTGTSNNVTGFSSSLCVPPTTPTIQQATQCNLRGPTSAMISNSTLVVADRGNSRVMIWTLPLTSGAPATVEAGQANFNTVVVGSVDTQSGNTYSLIMNLPSDAWTDGSKLVVSDTANNRVLYFNSLPNSNNDIGGGVIPYGQAKLGANQSGSGTTGLTSPSGAAVINSSLFVADSGNNRVLQYQTNAVSGSAPAAQFVFGQQDFTHTAYNDTDQNNQPGNQQNGQTNYLPANNVLYNPQGVSASLNSQEIYVTDNGNSRIMEFPISQGVNGTLTNNCNGVNPQI